MTYTVEQINDFVENIGWDYTYIPYKETESKTVTRTGWREFADAAAAPTKWNKETKTYDKLPFDGLETPFGRATLVEAFGGEGSGDQYWFVFKITNPGDERLFRRDGWYASYEGGEYDGPTEEVKPVVRPVTFFEPI